MAGRSFALALAAHTLNIRDSGVDDVALVGIHRLHLVVAAGTDHAVGNALCQGRKIILALVAVTAHVQAQLYVGAFHAVDDQAGQVGQTIVSPRRPIRAPMCSPVTRRIVASPFLTAVKLNSSTSISLKMGFR